MSDEDKALRQFLTEVAASAVSQLEAALSSGAVFRSSYGTVEQGVEGYRYAPGMSELDIALLPRNVDQWVWRDRSGYIGDVITGCPTIGDGVDLVMGAIRDAGRGLWSGDEEDLAERLAQTSVDHLSLFIITLADRLLVESKERRAAIVDEAVEAFLGDLAGRRPSWDVKVFLKCLWMEDEECALGDGVLLRRPRLDDYAGRTRVEGISWGGLSQLEVERIGTFVGSVLEVRLGPSSEAEVRAELRAVLDALLMFRVASVSVERMEAVPRSVLAAARLEEEDEGRSLAYHTVLKTEDHDDLGTFVREIVPLVRRHAVHRSLLVHRSYDRSDVDHVRQRHSRHALAAMDEEEAADQADLESEARAFRHYRSVLLDHLTVEERIARAVSGLEAIYLRGDGGVDRKRAVALRASSLLEGWGHDALKVAKDIREGIRVRGELYNGEDGEGKDLGPLSEDLAEYLRLSLVVSLQARRSMSQKTFIDAVDLLVQDMDLPEGVARVLEGIFVNGSVPQPYR